MNGNEITKHDVEEIKGYLKRIAAAAEAMAAKADPAFKTLAGMFDNPALPKPPR